MEMINARLTSDLAYDSISYGKAERAHETQPIELNSYL